MIELARITPYLFSLRSRSQELAGLTLLLGEDDPWLEKEIEAQSLPSHLGSRAWQVRFRLKNYGSVSRSFTPRLEVFLPSTSWTGSIWSAQGAATGWGQEFVFPLPQAFYRENYLGHLQDAEGGGVPFVYCWKQHQGIALMHLETVPLEWWMPVQRDAQGIRMAFENRRPLTVRPGEVYISPTFALLWQEGGDFFAPLERYRKWMRERGLSPPLPTPASYQAAWCSWGYEFDIHPQEVLDVLEIARSMKIRWFTLDDRWFDAYGDWNPRAELFPQGIQDLQRMNQSIHQAGGLSQLWWYPLCVEDGHGQWESHVHGKAKIFQENPDWVILDKEGKVARNNRHLAMLCPALPEVQEYTLNLARKFIEEWGFDGFKMDNIYTVPSCHNPAHRHTDPTDSLKAFAELYRRIFEQTRQIQSESVIQICPCGTPITFSLLSTTDQTVTADPTSSAQVRQRIKFYKALTGRNAAIFADHVELSDGGSDFASAIGTGGVPGSKFTWNVSPERQAQLRENWQLSPEKLKIWRFWFELFDRYRLAEGEYLPLYDLAFDFPETHVIQKEEKLYYAFFAPSFEGKIELRGLESRSYHLINYENQKSFGKIKGPLARILVKFEHHLLLEASPIAE